jgi:hypothetical protein
MMDEVEGNLQYRHNARLMTTTDEQITLDEALTRVREQFGAVRGDPVVSQERPQAMPN